MANDFCPKLFPVLLPLPSFRLYFPLKYLSLYFLIFFATSFISTYCLPIFMLFTLPFPLFIQYSYDFHMFFVEYLDALCILSVVCVSLHVSFELSSFINRVNFSYVFLYVVSLFYSSTFYVPRLQLLSTHSLRF